MNVTKLLLLSKKIYSSLLSVGSSVSPSFKKVIWTLVLSALLAGGYISTGVYYQLLDRSLSIEDRSMFVHSERNIKS